MKPTKFVMLLAVVAGCEQAPPSPKPEARRPEPEAPLDAREAPRPALSATPRTLPNDRPAPGNVQGRFTMPVEKP